jgi:hypothetical protein
MNSSVFRPARHLASALLAVLALLAGCKTTENPVSFASDPPGARIIVDGRDSGFVTPALLRLDRERQVVRLELDGFLPEERLLREGNRKSTIYWREMSVHYRTWHFPLWLSRDDTFTPYKRDKSLMPNRLFIKFKREADTRRSRRGLN